MSKEIDQVERASANHTHRPLILRTWAKITSMFANRYLRYMLLVMYSCGVLVTIALNRSSKQTAIILSPQTISTFVSSRLNVNQRQCGLPKRSDQHYKCLFEITIIEQLQTYHCFTDFSGSVYRLHIVFLNKFPLGLPVTRLQMIGWNKTCEQFGSHYRVVCP